MNKVASAAAFHNKMAEGKPFQYLGQTVLFITYHFDKEYIWLKDGDGTHYMVRTDDYGLPSFS